MSSSAIISTCGAYRYRLTREWDQSAAKALFLMLNPSTADADVDDPTIRKCIGFAKRWGMGGIVVVNLFALRSTDPNGLAYVSMTVAVGQDNLEHITQALDDASAHVVAAWGSTGNAAVKKMVRERVGKLRRGLPAIASAQCLGRAADGNPRHPLMLGYTTQLEPWVTP